MRDEVFPVPTAGADVAIDNVCKSTTWRRQRHNEAVTKLCNVNCSSAVILNTVIQSETKQPTSDYAKEKMFSLCLFVYMLVLLLKLADK